MKRETGIRALINNKIFEIKKTCPEGATVAFSGGLDSSVALFLAIKALGKDNVQALMVSFGKHSYSTAIIGAKKFVEDIDFSLDICNEEKIQDSIWKNGPSCNACTRKAKLPTVEKNAKFECIITGSNLSDSWGVYGIKTNGRFYSPLIDIDKTVINEIANYFNLTIYRAGENIYREGCKLKHLLKMNTNPEFHGRAVDFSNEKLISILRENSIKSEIANVKIIGPLSKNIALINIFPQVDLQIRNEIMEEISSISVIDDVYFVDFPITLTIVANPGLFNNKKSLYWVEKGRIQPEFVQPVKFKWIKSKNKRLNTFAVVGFEFDKNL